MEAVNVKNLWKTYKVGDNKLDVLKGISFSMQRGELVGLVGPSGSGKSTFLHVLGALDSPTAGEVRIGGFSPFSDSDRRVSHFRNRYIGFVFQHNNLLPEFSAEENVMLPALLAGVKESEARKRALALLERVGVIERRRHLPSQLSGGEQQRVAIARALVNNPILLLADEPSGNLDSKNAENIHNLFKELHAEMKTTILIVTHNEGLAQSLPRVVMMKDGLIYEQP